MESIDNRNYVFLWFSLWLMAVICVSCSNAQITPGVSASSTLLSDDETPISSASDKAAQSSPTLGKITHTLTAVPSQPSPYPLTVDASTLTPTLNPSFARVLTKTPNFHNSVTRTPSLPQRCPKVNSGIVPRIPKNYIGTPPDYPYSEAILDFLNAGGSLKILKNYLGLDSSFWAEKDLTGDGVPEILVSIIGLNIFMCNNGQYTNPLFVPLEDYPIAPSILAIQDMNLDGISELVIEDEIFSAGIRIYNIYEWDGKAFQSLIWPESEMFAWFFTPQGQGLSWYTNRVPNYLSPLNVIEGIASRAIIQDIDDNGTQELIVYNQIPPVRIRGESPWRATTDIYKWNGIIFMWDQVEIDPPIYRFQAVQDGDRMSLLGEYQKALGLYQAAIFSDKLYAWFPENYQKQLYAENQGISTPTPIPLIQDEYDDLAAYARYRIILLHILQGDLKSAQVVYETLQKKFPNGTPGYRYAEMATEFWQKYQTSQDLGQSCSVVVKYAEEQSKDIFTYLGNTESDSSHGTQSHYYIPWDMCPFE